MRTVGVMQWAKRGLLGLAVLGLGIQADATQPPQKGELAKYRADGSLARRQAFARENGNHRVDPLLVQDAQRRLIKLAEQAGLPVPEQARVLPTPPPRWRGMPSTGTVKMLVLCIDFSDYPHDDAKNSVAQVEDRVFGDGESILPAPYESLNKYYGRASYNQLNLVGNVLGWYRPAYTRASISQTLVGRQNLIKEALQHYDQQGHDFSQYDNNGDGKIDYFAVVWSGPDTGWNGFWWGYQTSWSTSTTPLTLDGKSLGKYSWQWEVKDGFTRSAGSFDPLVLIHETGHALGLPDYYDYDEDLGPDGGAGGLDMMDANMGDHNCFSKFLLDWINPAVYTATTNGLTLLASGDNKEGSSAIFIDTNPGSTFGEYFMVQNRHRRGNDLNARYPSDGLLIWHVDARLNGDGSDYIYDNSYADHKLLRLMEADGLEEIESYGAYANAGDYYVQGRTFGPGTKPNSSRYDGTVTRMGVQNISPAGTTMTLDIVKIEDATAPTGRPERPSGVASLDTATFTWTQGTSADADSGIAGYHLQVGTTPGGKDVYDSTVGNVTTKTLTDLGLRDGQTFYARVAALNGAGLLTEWSEASEGVVLNLPVFPGSTLESSTLVFKTIGPWVQDATIRYAGADSARSAGIGDMTRTYLQTRITGPGTLKFHWKVSSEANYDFLTLSLDGVDLAGGISGSVDWTERTLDIPAGGHMVRWTYAKDQAESGGSDQAWVDNVIWNGATVASATVSPASWTAVTGSTLSYRAAVANAASDNRVNWSISTNGGTFAPLQTAGDGATATTLSAGATAGTYTVTATPVEAGGVAGTSTLTLVNPADVNVTLTPPTTTVGVGATVNFTASVAPISDGAVNWTTTGGTLGAATGQTNTWSASTPGTYTITATSAAAPGRSDSSTVTVVDSSTINLVVTPATKAMLPGQSFTFTASGDQGGGVNWTVTGNATKVDSGLQTTVAVPSTVPLTTVTYTLTATSRLDGSKTAQAVLTVKSFDLNGDGAVDTLDILELAKRYELVNVPTTDQAKADFNGDGKIDDTDLSQLLAAI